MPRQSQAPILLLTRPLPQSQRFSAELSARIAGLSVLISPLMQAELLQPRLPQQDFAGVILASETAATAAAALPDRDLIPNLAYCIGQRTASRALALGFLPQLVAQDAADLCARLAALHLAGPLLFLRGEDTTGGLEESLVLAGTETVSCIVYRQVAQALSPAALAVLHGAAPVIVPLFSPRSAQVLSAALGSAPPTCPLWLAAMSPAVAEAARPLNARAVQVAVRPDSAAMVAAVAALIAASAAA